MHVRARQFEPVKAGHFGHADAGRHCVHLICYDGVYLVKPKPEGLFEIRRGLYVVDPLPPVNNPHFGAFCLERCSQRRRFHRSARRPVFMGKVEPEFVLVILDCLQRGQLNCCVACEAAWVDDPRVILRLAVHDLLRQQPTVTAAFAQTGAQADDAKGVAFARDRTHQRCAVNRIGNRSVDDLADAGLHQRGHARKRAFQNVRHAVQIIRAQRVCEMRVNPVKPPCPAVLFVETQQQTVLFLP